MPLSAAKLKVGDVHTVTLVEDLKRTQIVQYAGASGDFNPIHIDEDFAKMVGLPGRILHGLYSMAQVARAQTDAGGGPESLRRLSVQFRGMGMPEQEMVVTGTVREVNDGVATVETVAAQGETQIIKNAEADIAV